MPVFFRILALLFAIISTATAQTCGTTSFPTSNADPASADFVTLANPNGGVFSDFTAITCTTPATADAFGFAKFNMPYDATTANVGNVCYLQTLSQGSGYASRGSFMVDSSGNFVNAAGTAVASGDFETTADTGVSADIYYFGVVSLWGYIKDKNTAPEATLVRLNFGFGYCFNAVDATTACTLGSDTSGSVTATTASSELIFATAPSGAGKNVCTLTVTPSATSDVTLTTSGTAPTLICAHQTGASAYSSVKISTNAATDFAASVSVKCLNVALSTSQNTGSMVEITVAAATTSTTTTTTTTTSTQTSTTNFGLMKIVGLVSTVALLLPFSF